MITTAVVLLVGACGFVAVAVGIARKPEFAVVLVLLSELAVSRYALPPLSFGSLTIFLNDLPTLALLAAVVIRPYLGVARRRFSMTLLVVLLLAVLGLARGIRVFGLQIAGNNSREILSFAAAALFFSTVVITPKFIDALRRWFTVAGGVLITTALLFWAQNGFGGFSTSGQRALRGLEALILLFATIITIVVPYGRTRTRNLTLPIIGFIVLVLTVQRSVAVAGIIALIVIVLIGGRVRTRRSSTVTRFLLVIGGLAVGFLVLAGPTGVTQDLGTALGTSTTQEGTFSWRLEGWRILISEQLSGSVPSIVVGEPAGSSNLRVIGDSIVTVAPHSEYVSLFKSVGIVGLALMVWLLVATFRRNVVNVRSEYTFTATVGLLFATMLASLVVYFITYSSGLTGGLVIGLSVSLAWFGAVDPEREAAGPEMEPSLPVTPPTTVPTSRRGAPPPIDQPVLS
jgi:hypothetical protein